MKLFEILCRHAANSWTDLSVARKTGLVFVFLWFFFGGIAHFAFTDIEVGIVPPWLPSPRMLVLISGVFEIAGAVGIVLRQLRPLAGLGLFFLTLAVTPANVYMLQEAARYPMIPHWFLVVRLPLQIALLACIWTVTDAKNSLKLLK